MRVCVEREMKETKYRKKSVCESERERERGGEGNIYIYIEREDRYKVMNSDTNIIANLS